ncbi:MAG TPA: LysR family transcriptional regulator [Phenylobacterium sp.]|jgi:DNA-binding transcriptional LysR family regulator|nr:LysR family transcriptional regulator [Phenylobacterium sp.]
MADLPDWDLFQSLHAVLTAGSLSAAAKLRGLTQPTVGRHIDQLERELGAPLFLRSPRGLQSTELAQALKPHLDDMSAAAQTAIRDASGAADGTAGVVRVTASEVVGVEILPPILASFREQHPEIDIEVALSNRVEDLTRRDADIAVRMARPTQNTLVAKKVGSVGFGFYANAEYVERHGAPRTWDELRDHPVIGYDMRPPTLPDNTTFERPVTRDIFALRTDNDVAQIAAIKAGFGIGVCQHGIARREGLLEVLPGALGFRLEVWVCMHENLKTSRRMRLMFDHLVAGLGATIGDGN